MSVRFIPPSILPFLVASALVMVPIARAQGPNPAAVVSAGATEGGPADVAGATVKGTIADPDGAVIPGATVTFTSASGKATVVTSQADGTYQAPNLRPGTYSFTVTMQGFASFVKQGVRIAAGPASTVDAKMTVQAANQQVNVTTEGTTLSVDSDSNASATVIKGKDLEALSDDPDELSSELSALAGPAAGPNGGQIYVDGFTGGQLPPKSSIREIRINQNPFSAQYDKVGYGRVEVFTKPGADKFHGFFQANGNADFFNTKSPFLGTSEQEPYHTIFVFGNLTGPINSKASFNLGGSHRVIQDNTVFFGAIYALPGSTTLCAPGEAGCSQGNAPISIPTLYPQVRTDFTPRLDYQLAEKNTLTLRYQYETNSQQNDGTGGLELPSAGYNLDATENTIQIVDSQIFSDKLINETRFEYERDKSSQTPTSTAPSVSIQGGFTGGGSSALVVNDHQDHFEVQNYTSLALAKHFIRMGGRLRTTRDANFSDSQALGVFSYSNLTAYAEGTPSQYKVAEYAQPSVHATLADLGIYAEDDWKIKPNLTFTYGLRYETQNHIKDHHDFAPRISFAYGLGSNKSSPQTVIRGGFGVFYDRFTLTNAITTIQENGTNQQLFTVQSPGAACTPTTQSATDCGTSGVTAATQTTYSNGPNLRSPYLMQFAIGADRQLGKIGTVSVNYLHMRGVHQFNSQNENAPVTLADGTVIPSNPALGDEYQFASDGVFTQNQLSISPRVNYGRSISLWGYYSLNFAKSDTSGSGSFPSVVGDLKADYGRASFDTRNRLYMGGSFSLPHRVTFSPFMVATSGTPFNIITGTDLNGDSILTNDRPGIVTSSTPAANIVVTSHGSFDVNPGPGVPRIPINSGTGPAAFTLNLRATKTIGFGPETGTPKAQSQGPNGPPGGPGGGGRGGGGGGRGGPGGGGPGGFGGGANSGRRYSVSFGVLAANVFNDVDRGTPNGVVSSPVFYESTSLAGNIFSTNSAVRRITLLATFSF
jgi:hypothetical protein